MPPWHLQWPRSVPTFSETPARFLSLEAAFHGFLEQFNPEAGRAKLAEKSIALLQTLLRQQQPVA